MGSPTDTPAWQALQAHSARFLQSGFSLAELFDATPDRFRKFSLQHDNLLLDFSRSLANEQTLQLLTNLALQQGVADAIAAMFAGDIINTSEQRAARHVELRTPAGPGQLPEVGTTQNRMEALAQQIREGRWPGFSGKPVTDVVHLGVGGSDLGPALVVDALRGNGPAPLRAHFVSNIDPVHIESTLSTLDPQTTLFVVASKTFSTLETLHNAQVAKRWIAASNNGNPATATQFLAITANTGKAAEFGIAPEHILPLWDWVGGRYSVWSAIGLTIALVLGMESYRRLLAGAHAMDRHFRDTPLPQNLPVMLALLAVWYRAFFNAHSSAVLPYSQSLRLLPAYLQQLSMESLGKGVDRKHQPLALATGEPVWGAAGTDVQHSCMQLLHQGTEFVPVDFIVAAQSAATSDDDAHHQLLANCFSQSLALMRGRRDAASPYRTVPGNKPSNTLLLARLDAYNLGSLLALYEHKVFVQSVIWDINAFDQWGVELGKELARELASAVANGDNATTLDDSTRNLVQRARHWNGQR